MPDDGNKGEVPTYHANIATSNLNADEMTMELRWYTPQHKDWMQPGSGVTIIPAPSAEQVMAIEPVARVSLTFNAVRALKQYLDKAFPEIEKSRNPPEGKT
jgi:hypothetical protein